jgi:hypothetical protein
MSDQPDRDTVERMLRGEDAGPPELAALLAAVSARPLREDPRGEAIAVTAFREARSGLPLRAPAPRRLLRSRMLAIKAALVGFLLILAGGVAVAASAHLSKPLGTARTPATHTPTTSESATKHLTAPVRPRAPASRRPAHHRHHPYEKPHHRTTQTPPGQERKGIPSKGKSYGGNGPSLPGLPLPGSPVPGCDELCRLDG